MNRSKKHLELTDCQKFLDKEFTRICNAVKKNGIIINEDNAIEVTDKYFKPKETFIWDSIFVQ